MSEPEFLFPVIQVIEVVDAGDHDEQVSRSEPVCDFCFDLRVRWLYPCETFYVDEMSWGSSGEWLACDVCSEYIEGTMLASLRDRQHESWRQRIGEPSQQNINGMRMITLGFLANRCGERQAFG